MASHHRHHHHHHHQDYQGHCSSSSWCCCSSQIYQPSPPQDPLLSLLLQPHPYSPHLTPPHHQKHHSQQHTHSILSSLLRRIHDLESSLLHFSTPSSNAYSSYSLRDVAARIIQTHFRAFLVRRSTTLRQLKHLALVNSSFNSLKSSISNDTHFHSEALSHQAMALLLKLDSIQGGDQMIRDGKRSIRRELVRFLEFIDGVSVKLTKNVRVAGNTSRVPGNDCGDLGGDQREILKKLSGKLEKIRGFSRVSENDEESVELVGFQHISDADEENPIISINEKNGVLVKRPDGVQSRVKKSVSFAENGNVTRVFTYPIGSIAGADGSVSSDEEGEIMENLGSELEGTEEFSKEKDSDGEAHLENKGSQETSDGQRNQTKNLGSEISGHFQNQSGKFVFSAPLPVKMESRADLMKRKAVKIVK